MSIWHAQFSASVPSPPYSTLLFTAGDINHIYELWVKNRSEIDLRSCEATSAVAK